MSKTLLGLIAAGLIVLGCESKISNAEKPTVNLDSKGAFSQFDDFSKYPSSLNKDKNYAQINGMGNWKGNEWNVMREEMEPVFSGNYCMVRKFKPGKNNNATYSIISPKKITQLQIGFKYVQDFNSYLQVYISKDKKNWIEITDRFNLISHKATTTSADVSSVLNEMGFGKEVFVRFSTRAFSGNYWQSAIDDFSVKGNTK